MVLALAPNASAKLKYKQDQFHVKKIKKNFPIDLILLRKFLNEREGRGTMENEKDKGFTVKDKRFSAKKKRKRNHKRNKKVKERNVLNSPTPKRLRHFLKSLLPI